MSDPSFLFVTCQVGAEPALKAEVARSLPDFRFAYSQRGFVTFKGSEGSGVVFGPQSTVARSRPNALRPEKDSGPPRRSPAKDFDPGLVFARAWGLSLGKAEGATLDELAASVARRALEQPYDSLHVWQRDLAAPGYRGFQPHITPLALAADAAIRRHLPVENAMSHVPVELSARPGQLVLDCVLVEPDQWWLGWHRAHSLQSRWPGGFFPIPLPAHAVSRAYLKMAEALAWSDLPIQPGQQCVEIGCAPGGASQALLDRGMVVTGIDPALVDPRVAEHPNFTQVRKRGHEVRRREFRKTRWLFADMNVAPQYTLDTVEAIVTHEEVRVRGLILNLKLLEWSLADEVPSYLARVRSWGYRHVAARQLHHNRREVCLAAQR